MLKKNISINWDKLNKFCLHIKYRFITFIDEMYPKNIVNKQKNNVPLVIFYFGNIFLLKNKIDRIGFYFSKFYTNKEYKKIKNDLKNVSNLVFITLYKNGLTNIFLNLTNNKKNKKILIFNNIDINKINNLKLNFNVNKFLDNENIILSPWINNSFFTNKNNSNFNILINLYFSLFVKKIFAFGQFSNKNNLQNLITTSIDNNVDVYTYKNSLLYKNNNYIFSELLQINKLKNLKR